MMNPRMTGFGWQKIGPVALRRKFTRGGAAAMFGAEPGTYVLTDFLLRSFDRSVLAELGLDRYPELWGDYFGHYRRVVWLGERRTR